MVKATPAQIRACYDAARSIRNSRTNAVTAYKTIADSSGMNANSVRDVVSFARLLIDRNIYNRNITADPTRLILSWICEDFGHEVARKSAEKVIESIAARRTDGKSSPKLKVVAVVNEFLASLLLGSLTEIVADEADALAKARARSIAKRNARLAAANPIPQTKTVTTTVYLRNMDVVAEVLCRANGQCGHCHAPAPFTKQSDQTPYLEVHHRIPLAKGGDDTVENAIALCPNCHREAHHGFTGQSSDQPAHKV